jgi:hypothetical protein
VPHSHKVSSTAANFVYETAKWKQRLGRLEKVLAGPKKLLQLAAASF